MKVRYKAALCCIEGGGLISGCSCANPIHEYVFRETDHPLPGDEVVDATPSQGLDAATVEQLTGIRTSMALLQQNSEGCALNHYGGDAETHGLPGWLADTKRDLEALTDLLATEPHQHGGKGA